MIYEHTWSPNAWIPMCILKVILKLESGTKSVNSSIVHNISSFTFTMLSSLVSRNRFTIFRNKNVLVALL